MSDGSSVNSLVARVCDGDQEAWNEIIERYAPLVWSVCLRHQLSRPDIDDVGQSVWLLLIENIGKLREAAALPGWLATTTRRECLRVLRNTRRHDHADLPPEDQLPPDPDAADPRARNALKLDYSKGRNPPYEIARILRDYVVRVAPGSDDLLLGKAFFVIAGKRVADSFFVIERYRPISDADALAHR